MSEKNSREQEISNTLNNFSLKLYQSLATGKDENFFISPYSISSALSMCFAGAKSDTAEELAALLGFGEMPEQEALEICSDFADSLKDLGFKALLRTANRVFPNAKSFSIKEEYNKKLHKYFASEAQPLDFSDKDESAGVINKWVAEQTEHKIESIVNPASISSMTSLILVNAIYFKAEWGTKFKKELTEEDDFHLKDGTIKKVQMMKMRSKYFTLKSNPGGIKASTLELPYSGYRTAMTIVLPDQGEDIGEVEKQLSQKILREILKSDNSTQYLNIFMPKFKLAFEDELSSHFIKLGATLPFNQSKADFSGMSDDKGFAISQVIHKTIIETDEDGTVAAAATMIHLLGCCMETRVPLDYKINRPFLFVIHDKLHQGVLFIGKVMNPEF